MIRIKRVFLLFAGTILLVSILFGIAMGHNHNNILGSLEFKILVTFSGSTLFFLVYVYKLLNRTLSIPLELATNAAVCISQGDLNTPVKATDSNETKELVKSLRNIQAKLQKTINTNKALIKAIDKHTIVSVTDAEGTIIDVNNKFVEICGYSRDELLGHNHRIVKADYHPKEFYQKLWRTISAGETWQGTTKNQRKDGTHYWVDSTLVPLMGDDGKPKQYLGIRTEITQIKQTEHELIRLRLATDSCAEAIIITNADGIIEYVNVAFTQMTGWHRYDAISKHLDFLKSEETPEIIYISIWETLKRGNTWSGRLLNQKRNESLSRGATPTTSSYQGTYWVQTSITPISDNDGTISGYIAIQRDISEDIDQEKRFEHENESANARVEISSILQQQQLSLPTRFSKILDVLFGLPNMDILNKGKVFRSLNDSNQFDIFSQTGDFSSESGNRNKHVPVINRLFKNPIPSDDIQTFAECFCDQTHHGHYIVPLTYSDEILGMMQLYTTSEPTLTPSRNDLLKQIGKIMGLAIAGQSLQNEIIKARDAALENTRAKSEFLANMSHEIRTPLNGVIGMIDLLESTQMNKRQYDFLETARYSANSLLTLIDDILDFSKVEAGKLEIEHVRFKITDLVEQVALLFTNQIQNKNLKFSCVISPDLPDDVIGDPSRTRQNLCNFLGNAIKFTEQGEITLRVEKYSEANEPAIRFSVEDTGIGISATSQRKLFQSFTQADSSTNRQYGGTGLGLAICKHLCELMGGNIGLESESGKGSTFWFTIPLVEAKFLPTYKIERLGTLTTLIVDDNTADSPPPPDLNPSALPEFQEKIYQGKVLLVEDNSVNQKVASATLAYFGLNPDIANNGLEAIEKVHQNRYDLVFMDCQMPKMDGYEATRSIRLTENNGENRLPIIALTANVLKGDKEKCLAAGMDDYLGKPIKREALEKRLHRWLKANTPDLQQSTAIHSSSKQVPPFIKTSESSAFDVSVFEDFRSAMDDSFTDILEAYLAEAPNLLQAIESAINSQKTESLQISAHSLKSSSANIGALLLSETARKLEYQARNGETEVKDLLDQAKLEYAQVEKELSQTLELS